MTAFQTKRSRDAQAEGRSFKSRPKSIKCSTNNAPIMTTFQIKRSQDAQAEARCFRDSMTTLEKLAAKLKLPINKVCDMRSSLERKETNKSAFMVCKAMLSKPAKLLEAKFSAGKKCNKCLRHAAEEKAAKEASQLEKCAERKAKREAIYTARHESYVLFGHINPDYINQRTKPCDKYLQYAAEEKAAKKAAKEAAKLKKCAECKALRVWARQMPCRL